MYDDYHEKRSRSAVMRWCRKYNTALKWLTLKLSGKRSAPNLLHKVVFLEKKQLAMNFLFTEGIKDQSTSYTFHVGSQVKSELRNVVCHDTCHRNRNREARCQRLFVCDKGILGWQIIHQPKNRHSWTYEEEQVRTSLFQSRHDSHTSFLIWSFSWSYKV